MATLTRANRENKRIFKRFTLPLERIVQANKVKKNGQMYTLIGQQSVKKSSYITNFIVVDEEGRLVDESTAHDIYFIVMITILTEKLQPLNHIFKTQRHLFREHASTYEKHGIGKAPKEIVTLWSRLVDSVVTLENKQWWSEMECAEICKNWTSFWKSYQERATMLMLLPWRTVSKNNVYHNLYNYILLEAQEVAHIFHIEKLDIKEEPLNWENWLDFNGKQALANKRDWMISTEAEQQSQKLMIWFFYILVVGIITPFFTIRIYQDGFAYLFYIFVFYAIYFSLYYTNKYRLRQSMYVRMKDKWKQSDTPIFYAKAMSVNMATSVFYVVIATVTMFVYYVYHYSWDGITLFLLILMIVTLALSIWFPYSPFVEKNVSFFSDKIRAGHREFPINDIRKISIDKHKITYNLYLTYTQEPYEVYIEKGYRDKTHEVMSEWCKTHDIPFTLFDKRDRRRV